MSPWFLKVSYLRASEWRRIGVDNMQLNLHLSKFPFVFYDKYIYLNVTSNRFRCVEDRYQWLLCCRGIWKTREAIPGVAGTHLDKYQFVFYDYYIYLSVTKGHFQCAKDRRNGPARCRVI